jgi:hypothetical protein
MGRAAYRSQAPVSGSSAGQGSSSIESGNSFSASKPVTASPGKSCDIRATACRARSRMRVARAGSFNSSSASPRRRRRASSCVMANGPMQHCVHPRRQTSQDPLLCAASTRAASTIWISLASPAWMRAKSCTFAAYRTKIASVRYAEASDTIILAIKLSNFNER